MKKFNKIEEEGDIKDIDSEPDARKGYYPKM